MPPRAYQRLASHVLKRSHLHHPTGGDSSIHLNFHSFPRGRHGRLTGVIIQPQSHLCFRNRQSVVVLEAPSLARGVGLACGSSLCELQLAKRCQRHHTWVAGIWPDEKAMRVKICDLWSGALFPLCMSDVLAASVENGPRSVKLQCSHHENV